jgi:putative SOS response-associated peptidase YedK
LRAFAGLWDTRKPAVGETPTTFTIITCEPNELTAPLHNRMPVILEPADYRMWLEADDPRELLTACPVDMLQCFPVSTRVNKPQNDTPDLIEPAR